MTSLRKTTREQQRNDGCDNATQRVTRILIVLCATVFSVGGGATQRTADTFPEASQRKDSLGEDGRNIYVTSTRTQNSLFDMAGLEEFRPTQLNCLQQPLIVAYDINLHNPNCIGRCDPSSKPTETWVAIAFHPLPMLYI